jgi:amidase
MSNLLKTGLHIFLLLCSAWLGVGCSQSTREQQAARPPFEVAEASIAQVQQALKHGDCNCEQLVQAYEARIAAYDQPTKLNAIVVTNPEALATARELDAEYRRTGKLRPLHCIPLTTTRWACKRPPARSRSKVLRPLPMPPW